ncbi:hypothetical protein OVA07_05575 [Novosphingobium sp. SL115]|uniref:hypothetical protein n=1 Tax=Novosphingobium sp. SL115 TaxID=2995150 RepID=UPI002276D598|nr:hypothetical protein [Novosphingobium sp. SL115]MCY1670479.1 hypothetical protein [Novosphingobium sp. SL115]
MGRRGFGFGRYRSTSHLSAGPALLAPSALWTGVAGSGFTSIPVDPPRTTAKPAVRLIVPPFQWYTDELLVGVYAVANNGGSLTDSMGLETVIVHCEGTRTFIKEPTIQTFADANGNPVSYFGWWARLRHDGRNGNAHVYFEAVPKDSTMQRRVIGPYQFSPKAAKYSHQITVAATPAEVAGSRYKTLSAAYNYLKSQNATNPLVTITEAGDYDSGSVANGWVNGSHINGYVHLTATAPVSLVKSPPAANADPVAHRPGVPLHLYGANVTLDFNYAAELWHSDSIGRNHWLDGISLTNSHGRYDLYRKTGRNQLGWLLRGQNAPSDGTWVTECSFTNLWNSAMNTALVRGCTFNTCWSDLADHSLCFIDNRIDDFDSTAYSAHLPSLSLTYTGTGTTATIERGGGNVFTAKVNGATIGTFTATSTLAGWIAGTNYNVSDFVSWINGLGTDWSATLLDDTRAAWTLVPNGANYVPGSWPAMNVKNTTVTLATTFDVHADWWQKQDGPVLQNIICANNVTTNFVGAIFLIGDLEDAVFINNAWHCKDVWGFGNRSAARSQQGDYLRHFVFAHNTAVNQRFWLRNNIPAIPFDADGYCLWANNVLESFEWVGTPDHDILVADNHIYDGYAIPAAGASGTTQGGNITNLFVDPAQGNFMPTGSLLDNTKPPRITYDQKKRARAGSCAVGAVG